MAENDEVREHKFSFATVFEFENIDRNGKVMIALAESYAEGLVALQLTVPTEDIANDEMSDTYYGVIAEDVPHEILVQSLLMAGMTRDVHMIAVINDTLSFIDGNYMTSAVYANMTFSDEQDVTKANALHLHKLFEDIAYHEYWNLLHEEYMPAEIKKRATQTADFMYESMLDGDAPKINTESLQWIAEVVEFMLDMINE